MNWGAPFDASYHPARAFLLRRGLYVLLAFDAWLVMLEHGGRYGAGGFNVAHFAWLDAVLPLPSPALYVGLLVATGSAALVMALLEVSRWSKLLLAAVYTFSWAISLHDSYQHHYLLSWLLLWSAFTPELRPADLHAAEAEESGLVRAPGLTQTAFTCAIVYAFTAISKSSPEWRSGAVLMHLAESPSSAGSLERARDLVMCGFGVDALGAFALLSASVVVMQWAISAAYLAAPGRDSARSRLRPVLCGIGWLGSLAFHAGAELAGVFQIGWFSYYMLVVATVMLAPSSWLAPVARALTWPAWRQLARSLGEPARGSSLLELSVVAALVVWWGHDLDLPGVLPATVALSALGLGLGLTWIRRGQGSRVRALALAGLLAGMALWASLTQSGVRFDFYRRWAGEIARLGQLEQALALYRKAERYAPPGQSRVSKIRELERQLARPRQDR